MASAAVNLKKNYFPFSNETERNIHKLDFSHIIMQVSGAIYKRNEINDNWLVLHTIPCSTHNTFSMRITQCDLIFEMEVGGQEKCYNRIDKRVDILWSCITASTPTLCTYVRLFNL